MNLINKKYIKQLKPTSKIGLISDTHLSISSKSNNFLSHMDAMFAEFKDLCIKEKVDLIIITGDLFHAKSSVNTIALIKTNDILQDLSQVCPIIVIPGNHDIPLLDSPEITLASNYKHFDAIKVIEYPSYFCIGDKQFVFVPYHGDILNMLKDIKSKLNFEKNKIDLFGHFGVTSFKVHEYSSQLINTTAAQVSVSELKDFNRVFLGHYHSYQSKKNITYVSAPLQSRHGDELGKHGFVIYDLKTEEHKFYSNKVTPKFITFELNKQTAKDMLGLENHYIRIFVRKKVSKELIVALRQKLIQKNYEVKIIIDYFDITQIPSIKGFKDIIFNDDETLITNYLLQLEKQNNLPFSKKNLLKHLEIDFK